MMETGATDWLKLKHVRILLTGATGWFGTWLLDALVAANRSFELDLTILAMSRSPEHFRARHPALYAASEIEWIKADVRDWPVSLAHDVTHIIHAATEASAQLNQNQPDVMFNTIVDGTRNALRFAVQSSCRGFLLLSSGAIYGAQPVSVTHLSEDCMSAPDCTDVHHAYAEGKRAAEQLCAIWNTQHAVPTRIARCFAFVGPHMPLDTHFAIGNFIRDALTDRTIVIRGEGQPQRSYLYMTDLVLWLLAILLRGFDARPYNVGSDQSISLKQLAHKISLLSGSDAGTEIQGHTSKADRNYVPDVSRIVREMDVRTTVGLDDSIQRTYSWARRVSALQTLSPS